MVKRNCEHCMEIIDTYKSKYCTITIEEPKRSFLKTYFLCSMKCLINFIELEKTHLKEIWK